MKTKKQFLKTFAMVALITLAANSSFAQSNVGAACGCPALHVRPTKLISRLLDANAKLEKDEIFTCDTTYILDVRAYIPAGKIIKIAPGTVIKGGVGSGASTETALIIERGGKIEAAGTAECPIIFTAEADNLDGTYAFDNIGKWGGIVILGRATNNLLFAKNGLYNPPFHSDKLAIADGLGVVGHFSSTLKNSFGANLNAGEVFNDNDNSGILRYVSIRFSGAYFDIGQEINALTLASVGRGTTIDHIEIVSPADDAIEFLGGTVNVKYVSVLYGNDDMFDWDLGYRGKAQFLFGLKAPNTFSNDSDNGFESDSDDNQSDYTPRSHPIIYNATFIGNDKSVLLLPPSGDNTALAAINAKECTEGEIYNSVFANFRRGFNLQKTVHPQRPSGKEAYDNWTNTVAEPAGQRLKVKCNTFLQPTTPTVTEDFTLNVTTLVPAGADRTQFITTDKNVVFTTSIPGFDPLHTIGFNSTIVTNAPDAVPNPPLSTTGCPTAAADGFFAPTAYRGAFNAVGKNWLSEWSYGVVLKSIDGIQPCPTDVTNDARTTNADLGQVLLEFGKACK